MTLRRQSLKRFVLAFAFSALVAGAVVTAVPAASFNDSTPCPADGALLVCPSGAVDAPYSLQLRGVGGCDLYRWNVVNGSLPAGLSMSSSGVISGTPTHAGLARFWVTINDLTKDEGGHDWCNHTNQSEREFALPVGPGLSVTTTSAPQATVGVAYSLALAAAMKNGPEQTAPLTSTPTWSLAAGQLPPGLALGSDGLIAGTPTGSGSYEFSVRVALPEGLASTRTLSIEVLAVPLAVVQQPTMGPFEVGVPVSFSVGATGGAPPYTWSLSAGALPDGVVLSTTAGTIAGRPTVPGVFPFTVSVSDSSAQVVSSSGVLNVAPRLAMVARPLKQGRVGRFYRSKVFATGGVAPRSWVLVRGSLPRGVRFDRTLGMLSGIPKKAGRSRVRIQVVDALGVRSTRTFLIKIAPAPVKKKPAKRR